MLQGTAGKVAKGEPCLLEVTLVFRFLLVSLFDPVTLFHSAQTVPDLRRSMSSISLFRSLLSLDLC